MEITNWHDPRTPRKVYHYLYIKSLSDIKSKEQTFFVKFYQYLQWAPTRDELAKYTKSPEHAIKHETIFITRILPSNAVETELLEVERKGNAHDVHVLRGGDEQHNIYGEKLELPSDHVLLGISRIYQCTVSCGFALEQFPFDVQSLHLFFEASGDVKNYLFLPVYGVPACVGLEIGAMANDSQFEIHPPVVEFSAFDSEDASAYACCTLTLKVRRLSFAILVKVFTPATCLSLLCLSVFALPREDSNRLAIVVTLALALTAFQYVVSDYLPDLPYTTWADLYIMASFFFCTLVSIYVALGMLIASRETDAAVLALFSCLWLGTNAAFLWHKLQAERSSARVLTMSYSEMDAAGVLPYSSSVVTVPTVQAKRFFSEEIQAYLDAPAPIAKSPKAKRSRSKRR